MVDEFISPRRQAEIDAAAEQERKRAEYERFDQYVDDEHLPREIAIAAFRDERTYLDDRPDEIRV
jgi:uncharacterized damage-inducible protein DinB